MKNPDIKLIESFVLTEGIKTIRKRLEKYINKHYANYSDHELKIFRDGYYQCYIDINHPIHLLCLR